MGTFPVTIDLGIVQLGSPPPGPQVLIKTGTRIEKQICALHL